MLNREKIVRAALRLIPGIGSQRLRYLIAYFGSAVNAWDAAAAAFRPLGSAQWIQELLSKRAAISPDQLAEEYDKKKINITIPGEEAYPFLLAELADAPPVLYYKGTLRPQAPALAIVGSRRATAYGKAAAVHLAKEVAANGMVVVSGLARGIDSAAHKGALEGKGETWAVFGCGVDVVYPAENQRLADSILERGALLSEFTPGTTPEAQFFPPRNRLISGCAKGVVVVEAAERSGALITVDFALEQGREVFAVPGPIFSAMSKGTHHLLRQGAMIAAGIEDILGEVRMNDQPPVGVQDREEADAGEEEGTERGKIMALLSDLPLHIDQITLRSELTPENIALILLELELNGKVMPLPGQHFVLAR